mmetsp:Transcript_19177/g.28923  ORF Transcript_19177/g.28923 Transcript_19177/m.28923 type:complete len:261 (+) Transcript_19177:85-867(+)
MTSVSRLLLVSLQLLILQKSHAFISIPSSRAKSYSDLNAKSMSPDEIETWMSKVPVYAITENGSGGVVLLKGDAAGKKEICNFFTHVEDANKMMMAIQNANPKQEKDSMIVRPFYLGVIWFGLLFSSDNKDDGVEYRLVPSQKDLRDARELSSTHKFASPFGEIPIFVNWQMRIMDNGTEVLPLYLCLDDIQTACEGFDGSSEYEIKVEDLKAVVAKMEKDPEIDFRSSLLIPPIIEESQAKKETKAKTQSILDAETEWS